MHVSLLMNRHRSAILNYPGRQLPTLGVSSTGSRLAPDVVEGLEGLKKNSELVA